MKKEDIIKKIKKHKLFECVSISALESLLDSQDTETLSFKPGEDIFSPKNEEKKLGFLLCGEANVYSADGNRSVLLRSLKESDSFGISNLFGDNRFVSTITAKKASSVVFFSQDAVSRLLDTSSEFRTAYIKFLSEKICFLNKKISCFTAGSTERRLAVFLCSQSQDESFEFILNANALSEMLNVGRASLYRAFDKLTVDGFISKHGKSITVFNRGALSDYYTE